uniref:Glycosyltransferase n=1 Tax=Caldiarchaeum subterraneum TaxID=311458 RepID=A0A7C5YBL7_CALS0
MVVEMSYLLPRDVWILSFEYEGFAKAGGLGAAVARHARALVSAGVKVMVLIPSHGLHVADSAHEGSWNGHRIGVDGKTYPYHIGAESFTMDGVKLIVFRGLDRWTSQFLDEKEIYREAAEKMALFTRGVLEWTRNKQPPDIVHSHDWTAVLAAAALKTHFHFAGVTVPWVHTVHLVSSPSFPWHYASEKWCGLHSIYHKVPTHGNGYWSWTSDVWDSVGGNIDAFAAVESDLLTSVSRGYLDQLLARWPFVPSEKTGYIYNSTDWSLHDVVDYAAKQFGTVDRSKLRPLAIQTVKNHAEAVVGTLEKSKLLAVAHGRLVWQKGYDVLIQSVDYMDSSVGVLIMGLSAGDFGHESYLKTLAEQRPGRVMITRGAISPMLMKSVLYSANVAVMPSRYEPFGIASVEAQALGTPVVATNVPGLAETIKDIYFYDDGSGKLIGYEETLYLGMAVSSLAMLTEAADTGKKEYLDKISLEFIRNRFNALKRIRHNVVKWVDENFRERNTLQMLLKCYDKARSIALKRIN